MSFGPIKSKKFSRRDILFGIMDRFRHRDTPYERTGIDLAAREIDEFIAKGDYGEAVTKLQELLRRSPDHLKAKQKLGYCFYKTGAFDQCIEQFRSLLGQNKEDNFSLLYLGLALLSQGKADEAVEQWRHYFNIDQPLIQRALNLQIALYDNQIPNEPQEIIQNVEQAIEQQSLMDAGKEYDS